MAPSSYPSGSTGHPEPPTPSGTTPMPLLTPRHPKPGPPSNTTSGNTASPTPNPGSLPSAPSPRPSLRRQSSSHNPGQHTRRPTPSEVLDQINGLISARNTVRAGRRANNEPNVSEDEEILTGADFTTMYSLPQTHNSTQPNPTPTIPAPTSHTSNNNQTAPTNQPPPSNPTTTNTSTAIPPAPAVPTPTYAFCDADMDANIQQPNNHTIPTQLVAMVKARAYIPLSFFLRESMDRIRLELDLKTTKSMTKSIRLIDPSNFIDEKQLDFALFSKAYHNFIRCLKLCMAPGSKLPLTWADHFNHCSTDPRMKSAFKTFLYMDMLRIEISAKSELERTAASTYRLRPQ
ncbi:hypothetical protein JB92DRAFT_3116222 [Gautieria morchelliformis]|nr:hypothetical protein JB92DRAFT_3116222 [Gautieria morchelliformis]